MRLEACQVPYREWPSESSTICMALNIILDQKEINKGSDDLPLPPGQGFVSSESDSRPRVPLSWGKFNIVF